MAWYPGAVKRELQPESDAQPAIRPTQMIVHSLAAPWTAQRTYEYWRDSTNLESHFGLGYAGDLAQYIGTQTRADANAAANLRPDGTGAVSVETASNTAASDAWTDAQVGKLVALGAWLHTQHGVPLRICRSADDPGFGWHRQFSAWNPNGHSCPGDARVKQFKERVFPAIVARATGTTTEEDDMPTAKEIATAVLQEDITPVPWGTAENPEWKLASIVTDTGTRLRGLEESVRQLIEQGAARDTVLAQLVAAGGLDATQLQAAAEAGAQAALDRLAAALKGTVV